MDSGIFIDRDELREDFKNQCQNFSSSGSKIIQYYGVAGMGKTALLKNLMASLQGTGIDSVYHDFDSVNDMRVVLKKLARRFSKIGFEFPLFEMGCYLYEVNIGENVYPPKHKNFLEEYPFLTDNIGLAAAVASTVATGGVAGMVVGIDAVTKALPLISDLISKVYSYCVENLDADNANLNYKKHVEETIKDLEKFAENTTNEMDFEDKLVNLFAQDFSHCMQKNNRKIVIFLDSYEILLNKGRKTKEHPEPDWWLKEILNFEIPNVIWILSGRNKLRYLRGKAMQHELKPFDDVVSLKFLQSRGIEKNPTLCYQLTKLTRGYPLYLELCAEHYNLLKKKDKHHEPDISEFGSENEDFTDRRNKIVFNLIECMDDTGIRETIKYFCALRMWFDEMAYGVIPVFNETAYNILKNYSFVRVADNDGEFSQNFFYVDNAVQEILLSKYKKENPYVIGNSLKNTNKFFAELIKNSADDYIFCGYCYRLWGDTIVRLVDDADKLKTYYEEFFEPRTGLNSDFEINSDFRAVAENITWNFLAKVKMLVKSEENCTAHAYFELVLAHLNNVQRRFSTAADYAESAYKKFEILNNGENVILSLKILAAAYKGQGLNKNQIETQRQIVTATEKYFNDFEKNIDALETLYDVLSENNLRYDAIEVRGQMIDVYKNEYGADGEETLEIMGELADEWDDFRKFDKALEIRQEILEIVKGDLSAEIEAEKQIAYIYHHAKNYPKEIEHYEKVLELIRAKDGEYSKDLMEPLSEMAETFWDINNFDEWGKKRDEIVAIYQNKIDAESEQHGENSKEVIDAIGSLIHWLERIEANEDVAKWNEILQPKKIEHYKKVSENIRAKNGDFSEDLIEPLSRMAKTFWNMENFDEWGKKRDEIISIYQNKIDAESEEHGENSEEVIDVIEDLIWQLEIIEATDEVENWQNILRSKKIAANIPVDDEGDELEELHNKFDELQANLEKIFDSETFEEFVDTAKELAEIAKQDNSEIETLTEIIDALKDLFDKNSELEVAAAIIDFSNNLTYCYGNLKDFDAAQKINEDMLNFSKENFGDYSDETVSVLYAKSDLLFNSEQFEESLNCGREIIKIFKDKRGDETFDHIVALKSLAAKLYHLQRYDEAVKVVLEVIDNYKKFHGAQVLHFIESYARLAELYELKADFDNALKWRQHVIELYKKNWPPEAVLTIGAMAEKAATFEMAERFSEALELRKEIAAIYEIKQKKMADDFDENLQDYYRDELENIISLLEKINPAEIEIWQKKIDALENVEDDTDDDI